MRVQIVRGAAEQLDRRRGQLMQDLSLPLSVRGMISVHTVKPWIEGFWSVAIRSPSGTGDPSYLDFPIATDARGAWFFPSKTWWVAHAKVSHPPDGTGCDVGVHTKFLSSDGSVHEFDYATILVDGHAKILGHRDFVEECAWWSRAFAPTP